MNCCDKNLIKIYYKDEVKYFEKTEIVDDCYGEREEFISGLQGDMIAYCFCSKCKKIYHYSYAQKHYDTDEYIEHIEEISFEELIECLSKKILNNAELINFNNLKELCENLKIDMSEVIKHISLKVVRNTLLKDDIKYFDNDYDDEIPF